MQTHFSKNQQVDPDQNQDTSIFLLQTIKRPGIESLVDSKRNTHSHTYSGLLGNPRPRNSIN